MAACSVRRRRKIQITDLFLLKRHIYIWVNSIWIRKLKKVPQFLFQLWYTENRCHSYKLLTSLQPEKSWTNWKSMSIFALIEELFSYLFSRFFNLSISISYFQINKNSNYIKKKRRLAYHLPSCNQERQVNPDNHSWDIPTWSRRCWSYKLGGTLEW